MKNKKLFIVAFFLFVIVSAYTQIISIPHFENINSFYGDKNKPYFKASSNMFLKLRFIPTNVLYMDININADIKDLIHFFAITDKNKVSGEFNFFGASINFPHIKNKPLSLGIFTGQYDDLDSDSLLQEHVKTKITEPEFRAHFPGAAFKPQNKIIGTGLTISGAIANSVYSGLYVYWNQRIDEKMQIKTDSRFGGSFDLFSFNLFLGVAFPKKTNEIELHSGITMLFEADDYYDFFLEAGIAKIKFEQPTIESFVSNLYSSFEARIKKEIFNFTIGCFVSPVFLLPPGLAGEDFKDSFFAGLNTQFTFGSLNLHNLEGGFSVLTSVNPQKPAIITPFSFSVSPFITFKINQCECDLRFPINPLMYNNITQMFTGQLSIKAVF